MRVRPTLVLAPLAALALAAPMALAAPPAPQVTDPAGDATFTATAQSGAPGIPGANQAYADVLSVTWERTTTTVKKKAVFSGFTVKVVLSAPPTPPSGTSLVFRMLGQVNGDSAKTLGTAFYTAVPSDPAQPQSAVRDTLTGVTRLTKIDLPKIEGSTFTWTVPVSALPKEFTVGSTLANLYFEVREIEDFRGQKIPDGVPSVGGASGLAAGVVDDGKTTSSFVVG